MKNGKTEYQTRKSGRIEVKFHKPVRRRRYYWWATFIVEEKPVDYKLLINKNDAIYDIVDKQGQRVENLYHSVLGQPYALYV